MGLTDGKMKIKLPAEMECAEWVAYKLELRSAFLDWIDRITRQTLVEYGHQTCPYSNAAQGNIDVAIDLV